MIKPLDMISGRRTYSANDTQERARRMSHKDLAIAYGVTRRTVYNWLKPHKEKIGTRIGQFYTPRQVCIIYSILGKPDNGDDCFDGAN